MTNSGNTPKLRFLLLPALTILFLVGVQAVHFHDRAYRQDEAWVVHYAIENTARVGVINHLLQVFNNAAPENFLQDIWVMAFGHSENIVRFFSTLTTVLSLAMFYRFASDLFDKQTGRLAIVLLGTLSIFVFYTHEARPYAALIFGTVGFQWGLLRFIQKPTRTYALLTLFLGVVPFYQHPFLLYVYGAQVFAVLIFVRWNRDLYLRGIGLFVALGALVALRIYINFASRGGEISYATTTSIEGIINLYDSFKFNPESLGVFLFLAGWVIPISYLKLRQQSNSLFRFGRFWRQGWMLTVFVLMVVLVLFINALSPNLTPRNMIIITPSIALIAAYGLRHVPWQGQLVALVIFCIPFIAQFRIHNANAGYLELTDYMSAQVNPAEDRIIVIAPQIWEWIPIKYYLDERTHLGLSDLDTLYVTIQPTDLFAPYSHDDRTTIDGYGDEDFDLLADYLGERDTLWVVKSNPYSGGDNVLDWIEDHYTVYSRVDFPGEGYYRALEVVEYHRQPESLETVVRFGEDIQLAGWELNDSVQIQPCQTISVDTWWRTDETSPTLYSSTLVITDEDGQGIVNADDMPGGIYLTSQWEPDQLYFDERQLTVPCDIEPGNYLLLLGLYDIETVENLPVNTQDGSPMGTNLFYLTTLMVE